MKDKFSGSNPFRAGPATLPLHVAGREEELDIINDVLEVITLPRNKGRLSESPLFPLKIVGPRGVGKTTLLVKAGERAEQLGVYVVQEASFNSLTMTNKLLLGLAEKKKAAKDLQKRINQLGSDSDSGSLKQPELRALILEEALLAHLHIQPMVLLLDEVMHYELKELEILLRTCQKLISDNYPLALIMAGTPQLEQHLEQVEASFLERIINIYINNLSDAATQEALAKPFELRGARLSIPALHHMAKLTDNYPFFIQIVGREVWKAMRAAGKREAGLAEVRGAKKEIDRDITSFHQLVYAKVCNTGLLGPAYRVMKFLTKNDGKIPRLEILSVLTGKKMKVYGQEQIDIFNQLVDRGLIWGTEGKFSAGMPSFFHYCKKLETEAKRGKI